MAVGYFTDATGINAMLAERWNGAGWVRQRTPKAVGHLTNRYRVNMTLAERFS
jgi:hypothetical protein